MQSNLEQNLGYLKMILDGNIGEKIEITSMQEYNGERAIVLEEYTVNNDGNDSFDLVLISSEQEVIHYHKTWDVYIEPKLPRSQQWRIMLYHNLGTARLSCFSSF